MSPLLLLLITIIVFDTSGAARLRPADGARATGSRAHPKRLGPIVIPGGGAKLTRDSVLLSFET